MKIILFFLFSFVAFSMENNLENSITEEVADNNSNDKDSKENAKKNNLKDKESNLLKRLAKKGLFFGIVSIGSFLWGASYGLARCQNLETENQSLTERLNRFQQGVLGLGNANDQLEDALQ